MRDHSQLTIPQVIEDHYRALINETSETESAFVRKVREHYEDKFPHGSIEWSRQADPAISMMRDAEKFSRWLNNTIRARFPAEITESVIACFPVERRFALQTELAARQGLLAVQIPEAAGMADADNLGRLAKEAGEAISSVAVLLEDGVIDKLDADNAIRAINELQQVQAVTQEMIERINQQALGKGKPSLTAVKG